MKKMMKKLVTFGVVGLSLLAGATYASASGSSTVTTPAQAIDKLMAGNYRYVKGDLEALKENSQPSDRTVVAAGQKPYAIIVTCSDSRVPPEILFNKGLGEIFVVRVAGNVVAPHEMGSIEYAVEHIGSPKVIMVLGHERCGAVTATAEALEAGAVLPLAGNIGSLVNSIAPAVEETLHAHPELAHDMPALVEASCNTNVEMVAAEIEHSTIVEEAVAAGHLEVVGAKYDLDNGKVTLLNH